MNGDGTDLSVTVLGCLQVEDSFSSDAVLRFSQLFGDEVPFLHASRKQWGHDGSRNLAFTIECIILLCLCKLQRESFQVL